MNSVIYEFNYVYNKDKLIEESNNVKFFPINQKNIDRLNRLGLYKNISKKSKILSESLETEDKEWFKNQKTWKYSSQIEKNKGTEVFRIEEEFKKILKVDHLDPKFLSQEVGTKVTMHRDAGIKCAINFLISGTSTPIIFKNFGKFNYVNALINTDELHSVPEQKGEPRLLFKLRTNQIDFHVARKRLAEAGLLRA